MQNVTHSVVLLFVCAVCQLVIEMASDFAKLALTHAVVPSSTRVPAIATLRVHAAIARAKVLCLGELVFVVGFQEQISSGLVLVLALAKLIQQREDTTVVCSTVTCVLKFHSLIEQLSLSGMVFIARLCLACATCSDHLMDRSRVASSRIVTIATLQST